MEVKSDFRELQRVRSFVRAFCQDLRHPGMGEQQVIELELASSEIASNIMKHAYLGDTGHSIRIEAILGEEEVSVCFSHHGKGFDPTSGPPPKLDIRRGHGIGLYTVSRCVDKLSYSEGKDGSSRVCLAKVLRGL